MVPHDTLDDEIFANGLRERVSECRKRLRVNRVLRKRPNQGFSATAKGGFQEHSPMRELLAGIEFQFQAIGVMEPDSDMLSLGEEHEVGIT
jgi:hypothetical protein